MARCIRLQHFFSTAMYVVLYFIFTKTVAVYTAVRPDTEYLLVISCSGFRWDYLDLVKSKGANVPNFDAFIQEGVKAEYLQNSFPTLKTPNHWTIATGLYAESHGIVSDHFYDPSLEKYFGEKEDYGDESADLTANGEDVSRQKRSESHSKETQFNDKKRDVEDHVNNQAENAENQENVNEIETADNNSNETSPRSRYLSTENIVSPDTVFNPTDPILSESEPFWISYEKSSAGRHSGVLGWPGGEVTMDGVKATYSLPHDPQLPFTVRVDQVITWFTKTKDPARLALLYLEEPARTARRYGPESSNVLDAIVQLDSMLEYLTAKLQEHQLLNVTNIIITSDYGMTEAIETYRLVDYVDSEKYILSGDSPNHMFLPAKGEEDYVYAALQKIPHSKIYRKEELPERFHYTHNDCILPLVLMMEEGYSTCCKDYDTDTTHVKGVHGYDNELPSMRSIFLAQGPAFKSGGSVASPIYATDIYPLLCYLLDVHPLPNNGSISNIAGILAENVSFPSSELPARNPLLLFSNAIISFVIMFVISLVVSLIYFMCIKGPGGYKRPHRFAVDVPSTSPSYKMTEMNGDKEWLLTEGAGEDSGSDVEEWQPLKRNSFSKPGKKEGEKEGGHLEGYEPIDEQDQGV